MKIREGRNPSYIASLFPACGSSLAPWESASSEAKRSIMEAIPVPWEPTHGTEPLKVDGRAGSQFEYSQQVFA
jgi:hypothetical protein